jgi:hypothetical protein
MGRRAKVAAMNEFFVRLLIFGLLALLPWCDPALADKRVALVNISDP